MAESNTESMTQARAKTKTDVAKPGRAETKIEMTKLAIHKGKEAELRLGGLCFRACRREVGEIDGGVTLQVFAPVGQEELELLRFDCFRNAPHYHAPGDNPAETKIDPARFGDGRDWVYAQLSNDLPRLIEESGWAGGSEAVNLDVLGDLEPRLRNLVDGLPEPTETSYFEVDAALLRQATNGKAEEISG